MLKINDRVLIKSELRSNQEHREYIILGSKHKPYPCQINPNLDYFVYPPEDFDFILGDGSIDDPQIHELIYVYENDIVLNMKSL